MRKRMLSRCFLIFMGVQFYMHGQIKETRFESVEALMSIEKKPIVIFIHTSWCTYCKAMDATTFKNKKVIEKLNTAFYFIRLDAEEKRTITFLNRVFTHQPTGPKTGVHQLAQELGTINGKISYPSLCILDPSYKITFQHNTYLDATSLLALLNAVSVSEK